MKNETIDFLVIGAGLAGLACAADLQTAGATVRLLDKGRGVGGRMATRRLEAEGTRVSVDHGAQFFTARSERLKAWVQSALDEGWLTIWTHGFPLWKNGTILERPEGHPRYVPIAGMNDLAKRMAAGLDVVTGSTVTGIERADNVFRVVADEGQVYQATTVILNLPPVQLLTLARNLLSTELISKIETVEFLPGWTFMALLEEDVAVGWSGLELEGHPVLGWVSRDHTKRGTAASPTLVAHGSGAWSRAHLEAPPERVGSELQTAVEEITAPLRVKSMQVHRWRYALPVSPITARFLWDNEQRVGCCGDWCGGPRVEGALESGWSLASALLE